MEQRIYQGHVYRRASPGEAWQLVGPAQQQGMVVPKPVDPTLQYQAPLAQAELAGKQADLQRAPAEISLANAKAREAEANARSAESQGAAGAAKQRADAIQGFNAGQQLLGVAQQLREQYQTAIKEGGVDRWLSGVVGAFPTPENRTFNDTGNQARALIKNALGFTGGEGNTATESQINYGPFIPQAGDYNQQIETKIAALEDLAKRSQQRAIAQLGGVPDQNGRITPAAQISNGARPAQGGGGAGPDQSTMFYMNGTGPSGGGGVALAQGRSQAVADPVGMAAAAKLNEMLKGAAPDEQIASYAQQVGGVDPTTVAQALQFRRQNPQYTGDYSFSGFDQQNVPMKAGRALLNEAAQSPVGAYFMNAGNALALNGLDDVSSNPALARAGLDAASQQNPGAATLGLITGSTLGAAGIEAGAGRLAARYAPSLAPIWAARGADATYGALSGAGAADEGNRGEGALFGAAAGLGGGAAGRRIVNALGGAATGVRNAAIDELRTRGVPLTVGQALSQSGRVGGAIKGIEDRLSGLPVVGDMVRARRLEGLQGFRSAALDEALAPINATVENAAGDQAVAQAQGLVGDAYDSALSGVQIIPDQQFTADLAAISARAQRLPEPLRDTFRSTMMNRVAPMFMDNALSGRNMQGAVQGLRKDAGSLLKKGEVQSDLFKNLANEAEDALFGLAERQAPGTVEELTSANAANRRLSIVEDALMRAENNGGLPTPSQLGMAIRSNAKRFNGGKAFVRGEAPLQDLQRAGQEVLPSKVPDSGTAGRIATLLAPGALATAGGGAGYYAGDNAGTGAGLGLAAGALLTAGGSRAGQKLLTEALLSRPDTLRVIGQLIKDQSGRAGAAGVGSTQPLLVGY